ncbi:GNAT family N-acetyltransferase [Sinorhizobium psoraleae]|uniref:GNAT family N-acetyltransferase n=1 Tax=Sinorhizobium psoraleae TaxID=520838 RepID=A0ABT4KM14_9HYPH|nr:GNAT family N-acetyltransferase [Sinorhizobium psoraleae]MCZ4091962.1 GNAT family N-acetyltransferase [Sinorhizobium psoraleae]
MRGPVTDGNIVISDLRAVPHFADAIADRVWRAWWKPKGFPLEHVAGLVRENLGSGPLPLAIVAHRGSTFVGTASVIASDMEERPQYTPWVAAVWVDPAFRRQGIGGTIVGHAARAAFAAGADTAYLCAVPAKSAFYQGLGWSLHEQDVGDHRLDVFTLKPI